MINFVWWLGFFCPSWPWLRGIFKSSCRWRSHFKRSKSQVNCNCCHSCQECYSFNNGCWFFQVLSTLHANRLKVCFKKCLRLKRTLGKFTCKIKWNWVNSTLAGYSRYQMKSHQRAVNNIKWYFYSRLLTITNHCGLRERVWNSYSFVSWCCL